MRRIVYSMSRWRHQQEIEENQTKIMKDYNSSDLSSGGIEMIVDIPTYVIGNTMNRKLVEDLFKTG